MADVAIALLAGGRARRFPGKLERPVAGRPMLAHVYERVRECGWPIYLLAGGSAEREFDAPLIVDRNPGEGPLRAFADACAMIPAERIFAVAGDQPLLEAGVLRMLAQQWRAGDEAIVPEHEGQVEPLAALYSRRATLREAAALRGDAGMRDLVARLATRFVACDGAYFYNVNRAEDLAALERSR
jgi:molybdopterin-guanine dinucleotide biosynthesis protein A